MIIIGKIDRLISPIFYQCSINKISENCKIKIFDKFQGLSASDYRNCMSVVENAILSTDMGLYFKKKNTFLELSDNGEFDWQSPDKKQC